MQFLSASIGSVFSYICYILLAVLVLLVMITVHEFGHFISGKLLGFKIEEFSIGFGPKIFSRKKENGEVFSIRAIPLGGFCAFFGEDEENKSDERAFNNRKPWQRIIVLISGALMNYLLSLLVIITLFTAYGQTSVMAYKIEKGGLKPKDVILNADGKNIYIVSDLLVALDGKVQGEKVPFRIYREGEIIDTELVMFENASFNNIEDLDRLSKVLGLQVTYGENGETVDNGFRSSSIKMNFFKTVGRSFDYSGKLCTTIFKILGQLLSGDLGIGSVGGTVTTISVTADAIKVGGLWSLLNITALIGVNLALFNLLPFPALDGSRVLFVIIEWIAGKPVNRKVENAVHTLGFILLLLFAVFIDFQRFF